MIKKTLTETYSLRGEKCLWAKINLDCGEESVNVMISSDYGEFSHYWGFYGMNPKAFLTTTDMHYTMKKLMSGVDNMYEPDFDARLISFKKMIIEDRKEDRITKGQARSAWEKVLSIFEYCQNSNDVYYSECFNADELECILYDMDAIPECSKMKNSVIEFWEDIWIPFISFLKDELKAQS
ncbi:MAG: hypothetical protein Q7T77_04670 [Sulfuricurvum sp.]|nr:hypothetical protein [Sulfuricurvum sp.]